MKYVKMLELLGLAAIALTSFAGTASATELTAPKGTKVKNGAAVDMSTVAPSTIPGGIQCELATLEGKVSNEGGANTTVEFAGSTLKFILCKNDTVAVLDPGVWVIHTKNADSDNKGTVTSSGVALTVTWHRTIFGFPITTHCIYETENTHMGTIEGSTLSINATVPARTTDSACGETNKWTALYSLHEPFGLVID